MQHILSTFIFASSLGFFCIGLNFYIDLHLGYEFLSIAIALEVASFLYAIALSKYFQRKNINELFINPKYNQFENQFINNYDDLYYCSFYCWNCTKW